MWKSSNPIAFVSPSNGQLFRSLFLNLSKNAIFEVPWGNINNAAPTHWEEQQNSEENFVFTLPLSLEKCNE